MSSEENKAIIRRVFEEIWNQGNLALADELVAADYVNHAAVNPDAARGPEGYKQGVQGVRAAFPDWHETIEDVVAEGDTVVVRFTIRGTQQGEMASPLGTIPPSGRSIGVPGIAIYRLRDGKLVERWGSVDGLGLFQQLGAIPAPAQAIG